ncbi:hypothetical protein [Leucothrix pacifica]|uniref:HPr kinase/phosphorylase C-terminal domain-containing protein n=1 Tax=Leucothrix pacifica TaxID=1247513 RepID=A0A317C1U0_9GAMM|nr:hypothetical protein [Leucothrix pacifica]PWQ92595.1 hypothetical protein DKW60_20325 [Leucothrix pacifica]
MSDYTYYDLNVRSDLPLPELLKGTASDNPDVVIKKGLVSATGIEGGSVLGPFLQTTPQSLWLSVPNVARFLINEGKEIVYEPHEGIDEDSIRVFMLGSCTGALMFQRDHMILHGNAFQVGDGCVVCVGNSGAGKSTLAAAIMQRGYRIISDDVCPIDAQGFAISGMPRIKLWKDSADRLAIDTNGLKRIRPELQKFNYPLNGSFCSQPLPVKAVYILNTHNESEFEVERINGMDKFEPLKQNTYRFAYLKGMSMEKRHFKQCAKLATNIHLSRLTRPRSGFQLEKLVDFILDDITKLGIS